MTKWIWLGLCTAGVAGLNYCEHYHLWWKPTLMFIQVIIFFGTIITWGEALRKWVNES